MQRVRAGLTGLAAIFLMVLIAAAGLKPGRSTAHTGTPTETLAVLGVAPGSNPDNSRETVAKPAPVVKRLAAHPRTS